MSANNSGHDDLVGPRDIDVLTSLAFTNTTTAEDKIDKGIDEKGTTVNVKEASYLDDDRKLYGDAMDGEVEGIAWKHDDVQAAAGDDNDPEYRDIPLIVRQLVDFEDDPSTPILTWRFFFLSTIFVGLGAWLVQMGFFRTTTIPYSVYFVQIASFYFGRFLAARLPEKEVGFGRFKFQLNPGPFSVKEHVAIVLAASTGATNNLGDYVLAPLIVFYDAPMNGWLAILFMWACVFVGFTFASFARSFLVEDPKIIFPLTLQRVSVFKAMRSSIEAETPVSRRQMKLFWYGILVWTCWQFFPEYIFPMTSSLTLLCWVSSNPNVVFAGSGLGGSGFGALTLDWSNIGSTMIYQPFWTLTNQFAANVLGCWILLPLCYYLLIWDSDKYPVQSQALWQANGSSYPTAALMNADFTLNEELFAEIGVPRISAQLMWGYFFSYVAYVGSFMTLVLFQGPMLWRSVKAKYRGEKEHHDKLNKIMEAYPPVPWWWNAILFAGSFIVLLVLTCKGVLYMPIYGLFFGLAFGAVICLPMGYIYATSGFSTQVGYFNEIVYGYMINIGGSRHPVGSLSYRCISGQAWYEAQAMLSDMKLGHYFHVPPRAVLWAQIWGILVGVPINYATIVWVCQTKFDYMNGTKKDPLNQWTGSTVISLNNQSIQFALVGPKRLFNDPAYTPLVYGFAVGAALPILLRLAHWARPKWKFNLWNVTIFASTMETHYVYNSVFFFTWYILGCINHLYVKRRRPVFWARYAYIAGAAADTGFNFAMLLIFCFFSAGKTVSMPNWFGNNADSVERCFPASP